MARSEAFREKEREKQVEFKLNSKWIPEAARAMGHHGKPVDYCFPEIYADENLYPGIREGALAFFHDKKISWHSLGRRHVLSSQAYCVNFLFPFAARPHALRELMKPALPDIHEMLPIEDEMYVTFEWNGAKNYLEEHGGDNNMRGELATFPDAAIKYRDKKGRSRIVLIEWKYTERYSAESKAGGESGANRFNTYRPFIVGNECPLNLSCLGQDTDQQMQALFYEPFYQLMREQLLAFAY